MMLMICSVIGNAGNIDLQESEDFIENPVSKGDGDGPLGNGGWHPVESYSAAGEDFDDIQGDWEYFSSHSIIESPNEGDDAWCEAEYNFNVYDNYVKYLTVGINYVSALFSFDDGPQLMLYDWDDGDWWISSNFGYQPLYDVTIYRTKTGADANQYIKSNGDLDTIVYAWDSNDPWSGDCFANYAVWVEFQAADEEINSCDITLIDSDNNGFDDSVEAKIDVDVGDLGDGTKVDVTAHCVLYDPQSNLVDVTDDTWMITDWQEEYGILTTSALGHEVNGQYTIEIEIYDEYGNMEDSMTQTVHLTPFPQEGSDLDCSGSLNWNDIGPGETVTGTFTVKNVGDSGSLLDWEVDSYPNWGTWTFTPSSGTGLLSGDTKTVNVKVVAPNQQNQQYSGTIKIVNSVDPNDYENIDVSLATPQNTPRSHQPMNLLLLQLLERFPLLERLLLNLQ